MGHNIGKKIFYFFFAYFLKKSVPGSSALWELNNSIVQGLRCCIFCFIMHHTFSIKTDQLAKLAPALSAYAVTHL